VLTDVVYTLSSVYSRFGGGSGVQCVQFQAALLYTEGLSCRSNPMYTQRLIQRHIHPYSPHLIPPLFLPLSAHAQNRRCGRHSDEDSNIGDGHSVGTGATQMRTSSGLYKRRKMFSLLILICTSASAAVSVYTSALCALCLACKSKQSPILLSDSIFHTHDNELSSGAVSCARNSHDLRWI
jgi:hypothetical protein